MSAEKTVSVRLDPSRPDSAVDVRLEPPAADYGDRVLVYIGGTNLGTLGSSMGTLDRPTYRGLLRIPGKERKLWWSETPTGSRARRQVSRAEAVRHLWTSHEWANRGEQ